MSDPYNTAPPRKDPWREVPVKKDRRKTNPRPRRHSAKWDRCVAEVAAKGGADPYAVCTKSVRKRRINPRKLSAAAQRRQAKSLLDWSAAVLRAPDAKLPGGRMSHSVARDQISLVRQKYARNPRTPPYYLLEAHRGKDKLYYAGKSKFGERSRAQLLGSRKDARALAVELKAGFPKALKGWALRVVSA